MVFPVVVFTKDDTMTDYSISNDSISMEQASAMLDELTPEQAMEKLRECLRDRDHPLTKALADLGVAFVQTGYGRGSRSYLMKH